ncbi:MAG TPA: hypothetical protein VEL12_02955 [Candidatus Nitrosopolaris sp.]|nr:hypothetical protein [Candidatus Nitrosopolaris sp.]
MSNAGVDPSYTCPVGAHNAAYDIHGTIDARNGTSKAVTITAVEATLTLEAVKGEWLQKLGDKYLATNLPYSPAKVPAGAATTLTVTIPSACTGRVAGAAAASADYAVSFTLTTSAGNFKTTTKNRHRISTG